MFDWFEQLYDVLMFSFFFSLLWEGITLVINSTNWATVAPAWQVAIVTFSWEKLPLVFLLGIVLREFNRSRLHKGVLEMAELP